MDMYKSMNPLRPQTAPQRPRPVVRDTFTVTAAPGARLPPGQDTIVTRQLNDPARLRNDLQGVHDHDHDRDPIALLPASISYN